MRILNIHGYNGSPENSAYKALAKLGHEIISPAFDYENESPDDIMGRLSRLADDEHPDIIVGTSLGGFYAAALSVKSDIPVILVNPFLMAFLAFPEYTKYMIGLFGEFSKLKSEKVSCIVGSRMKCWEITNLQKIFWIISVFASSRAADIRVLRFLWINISVR